MNLQTVSKSLTILAPALLASLVCASSFASNLPSFNDADLGRGTYSRMHMLLEKTILAVDVATIEVRVDPKCEKAFEQIAKGKPHSYELEHELAKVMFASESALFELRFLRDITLDQYVNGVRESLEEAHAAGIIDGALRHRVSAALPETFKTLKHTGFEEGDRILYKITPGQLRTVVIRKQGDVPVDRTDLGVDKTLLVLGSYFAKGTDYRELLLRSVGR
jgi:hypothetical protein